MQGMTSLVLYFTNYLSNKEVPQALTTPALCMKNWSKETFCAECFQSQPRNSQLPGAEKSSQVHVYFLQLECRHKKLALKLLIISPANMLIILGKPFHKTPLHF